VNLAAGNAGLVLGLLAAVVGAVSGVVDLRAGRRPRAVVPLAALTLAGVGVATVAMQVALQQNDTTVDYVARHGSSKTPFPFDVATMWSALEGSILLWALVLCGLLVGVVRKFRARLDDPLVGWALVVMFVVCAFFFVLMLGPAAVFERFDPPPGYDGPGPNPLLQNHIMVAFHPPMLYLGYVGFTVPFAFALAALITGRMGEGWLAETRRWTLLSWAFLTGGIVFGAWWAYEVTGWGGYWAWDPIENASLLPWLTATAFLHSVMVQERRGMLRVWNLSLVCATFSLTILGTFLARSGVIDSVHAFANGSIGPTLLGFFAVVVAVSVGLIAWRGDQLRTPGAIDSPMSREGAFLANNLLFAAFAFVVLLGTVFPLVVEAVNGDRISVGAPFFDRMTMPLGMLLLFLMAVAPVLPWRTAGTTVLADRLWWPAWTAVGVLVLALVVGARGPVPLVAFALAGFAGGSALRQLVGSVRRQRWRGLVGRTNGGMVVHLGTIVVAVALASSQSFTTQGEFRLEQGESARVAGHTFTYVGNRVVETATRREVRAEVRLEDGRTFEPANHHYVATGQAISRPSVRVGPFEDLYLNLTREPTAEDPSIRLRVFVQPLVVWLWIGGVIMVVGTFLAMVPAVRRRRGAGTDDPDASEPDDAPEPDGAPAVPV